MPWRSTKRKDRCRAIRRQAPLLPFSAVVTDMAKRPLLMPGSEKLPPIVRLAVVLAELKSVSEPEIPMPLPLTPTFPATLTRVQLLSSPDVLSVMELLTDEPTMTRLNWIRSELAVTTRWLSTAAEISIESSPSADPCPAPPVVRSEL